jgi:quinol-cytochrome oxidoreductase complex cytochrome b subunit
MYFLLKYTCIILVPYFRFSSVFGLSVLVAIVFQMLSGFFLALNYIPDPSFVIIFREENINEM